METVTIAASEDLGVETPQSLDQNWLYKIAVLADRIARHTAQIAADAGDLNLSQWRVLVAIADQAGRTASDVVDLTPMDKGIVSRAVTFLVAEGHLRRERSDKDARRTHLFLTPSGEALYQQISERLVASGAGPQDVLPSRDTKRLLGLIDSALAAYPTV